MNEFLGLVGAAVFGAVAGVLAQQRTVASHSEKLRALEYQVKEFKELRKDLGALRDRIARLESRSGMGGAGS